MYYNIQTSPLREQARKLASSMIVVADSTKFGESGFIANGSLSQADVLVSDRVPDPYRAMMSKKAQVIEL
jgi:DeoR/GlpR family transcriptional regulator of sugar metabolism